MDTNNEVFLKLLKKIDADPNISQRDLSNELEMSLGKINYCLKSLKLKGLIKINNFKKSSNKLNYLYNLTPKGIMHKTQITIKFMKIKMEEYDELKRELTKIQSQRKKKK
tara:strand:+ start:270 stop:599 length:330 start_codon:yes stop_codon:yes gene_type:complete